MSLGRNDRLPGMIAELYDAELLGTTSTEYQGTTGLEEATGQDDPV